jgi:hypothetical protein
LTALLAAGAAIPVTRAGVGDVAAAAGASVGRTGARSCEVLVAVGETEAVGIPEATGVTEATGVAVPAGAAAELAATGADAFAAAAGDAWPAEAAVDLPRGLALTVGVA